MGKINKLFYSLSVIFLFAACSVFESVEVDDLTSFFESSYIITGMETDSGSIDYAEGDPILIETVNDTTINMVLDFQTFNSGKEFRIDNLLLVQDGSSATFNQDFGNATVSGRTSRLNATHKLKVNIDYDNGKFVHIEAESN